MVYSSCYVHIHFVYIYTYIYIPFTPPYILEYIFTSKTARKSDLKILHISPIGVYILAYSPQFGGYILYIAPNWGLYVDHLGAIYKHRGLYVYFLVKQ